MDKDLEIKLDEIKELILELKKELKEKDKKIEELTQLVLANTGSEKEKSNIEEIEIINNKNPEECYKYALTHPNADIKKLGRVVIDSKNLQYNLMFMKNIKDCDFEEHLKVIIDSKDSETNYFASLLHLNPYYIEQIRNILVNNKSVEYCYEFAHDINEIYGTEEDIDVSDLELTVIESKDINYNYKFAKNVKGADIDFIQDVILKVATEKDIERVFDFAIDVKGADLNACKNKIISLYKKSEEKKEIISLIDQCERKKIKCIFRQSFADDVIIK